MTRSEKRMLRTRLFILCWAGFSTDEILQLICEGKL